MNPVLPQGDEFTLSKDTHLPSEQEMRKMVSPDDVCAYEAMAAAVARARQQGMTQLERFFNVKVEDLRLAAEQLQEDRVGQAGCAQHMYRGIKLK